jgi:hypothetical protein
MIAAGKIRIAAMRFLRTGAGTTDGAAGFPSVTSFNDGGSAMEERKQLQPADFPDLPNLGLLVGVIVAAFIALGATIYFFGEDQSQVAGMKESPTRMERTTKAPRATDPAPGTVGQGTTR